MMRIVWDEETKARVRAEYSRLEARESNPIFCRLIKQAQLILPEGQRRPIHTSEAVKNWLKTRDGMIAPRTPRNGEHRGNGSESKVDYGSVLLDLRDRMCAMIEAYVSVERLILTCRFPFRKNGEVASELVRKVTSIANRDDDYAPAMTPSKASLLSVVSQPSKVMGRIEELAGRLAKMRHQPVPETKRIQALEEEMESLWEERRKEIATAAGIK